MGDISEMRGLVVVGSFLAMTVLLIGFIPPQFYTVEAQRTVNVPEYFESVDLGQFNKTYEMNITGEIYEEYWGYATFGRPMRLVAAKSIHQIINYHGQLFVGLWTGSHKMEWINDQGLTRGEELSASEIQSDWDATKEMSSYTIKCKHFYMKAFITYDTTNYTSVVNAWDTAGLYFLFAMDWDQMGTSWNVWSLITGVLFFKLPQIDPYTNAFIALPLWLAIAYMSFIFALRVIGAIFGGGGA